MVGARPEASGRLTADAVGTPREPDKVGEHPRDSDLSEEHPRDPDERSGEHHRDSDLSEEH